MIAIVMNKVRIARVIDDGDRRLMIVDLVEEDMISDVRAVEVQRYLVTRLCGTFASRI
jgi:hypothetical protein